MKIRSLFAAALILAALPAWATTSITTKNVQVPSTGTLVPGAFLTDGTNIWFGMDIYDGTTWATFNGDGGLAVHLNNSSIAVTGTFWQTTQPVSAAALPLPTGASTSTLQTTGNTELTTINTTLGSPLQAGGTVVVSNTNPNGSATSANSSPVVIANDQNAVPVAPSPYPAGSTPITASATGTTAATTATLTNVTGHTTYICGFSIRANATAAATGNATVTGTISGTLNFTQWTAPNASGVGVTEIPFAPCVPASAVSTSIAVVSAAPGTGGVVSVSAWGYSI